MESIAVPAWLAQAVAVGIGGQFVLLVGWLIRQDKNRALAEKDAEAKRALGEAEIKASVKAVDTKVDGLVATLNEHNPIKTAAAIQAVDMRVSGLVDRLDKLDAREASNHATHHKLLRQTQRRLDVAGIGVSHDSEKSDSNGDDE
jgi:hypothetical protein